MSSREPLSGVDAAWLHMDAPLNRMVITSVFVFEAPLDLETFKALLAERLLGFPRFRQRVYDPGSPRRPYWGPDPNFDLDRHVHRGTLPEETPSALRARVGDWMSEPLDRAHPLWHMELIEDYRGGSAVIVRLHHCIGDGMALVQVLLSLTDEHFDPARFPHAEDEEPPSGVLQRTGQALRWTASAGRHLLTEGGRTLLDPSLALRRARQGWDLSAALARYVTLGADSDTALRGDLEETQRATWSSPIELARVKRVGRALDATVNDVLLGVVAGSLRGYLCGRDDAVVEKIVRALVPVNLRPIEEAFELGNQFGLVYLDLPIGEENRSERVRTVKQQMDRIKESAEAVATFGVLEGLGYVPVRLEAWAVRFFSNKASAVITNVPGPQEPLHMKGRRLKYILPWVPRAGRLGLGLSLFSYEGGVRLGVACDAGLVPDPTPIAEGFVREFDRFATDLLCSADDS